jgi:hypothetical protein
MLLVFIGCPLKNQDDPFCSSPLKNQDDPFVSTTEKARWPRLQHALKNQDDPLFSTRSERSEYAARRGSAGASPSRSFAVPCLAVPELRLP